MYALYIIYNAMMHFAAPSRDWSVLVGCPNLVSATSKLLALNRRSSEPLGLLPQLYIMRRKAGIEEAQARH
jgi:hypothetical protein